MGLRIRIQGERACFRRHDRVRNLLTYPIIPPTAAVELLRRIHGTASIEWSVQRITCLSPIAYSGLIDDITAGNRIEYLKAVDWIVECRFDIKASATFDDTPGRHLAQFDRRLRGQTAGDLCLGLRNCPARVTLLSDDSEPAVPDLPTTDLGWLPYRREAAGYSYFHATLIDGMVEVPLPDSPDIAR